MASPKSIVQRPARAAAPAATPEGSASEGSEIRRVALESPSMEVLEELEIANALANLEMRMDSLEIDTARQAGSREDDARRIAGEMAVMKARVEDALNAFALTAEELRLMVRDMDKRLADEAVKTAPEAVQAQLSAGLDGVMAGLGDVLEGFSNDVRSRVEQLGGQMDQVQQAMTGVADTVGGLAPLAARLASLEQTVARLAAQQPGPTA